MITYLYMPVILVLLSLSSSVAERLLRKQGVAGSNPA